MIASEHEELDGIGQITKAPSYVVVKVYDSANPDVVVPNALVVASAGSASYSAHSGSDGVAVVPVESPAGTSFDVTAKSTFYESVSPVPIESQGYRYWNASVVPAQKIDVGPLRTETPYTAYKAPGTYAPASGGKPAPFYVPPTRAPLAPTPTMTRKTGVSPTTYIVIGASALLVLGIGFILLTRK